MTTNIIDRHRGDAGFSLIEMMISTLIFTVISGVVIGGMLRMNNISTVVGNRTEMHSGVRNATELLQQEVGQAGRMVFVEAIELDDALAVGENTMSLQSASGNPTAMMFPGMFLIVGNDEFRETVQVSAVDSVNDTVTLDADYLPAYDHAGGTSVSISGGFAEGVIPPSRMDGSTDTVLKLLGDIQGDGSLVYIEYTCDTANNRLYRNVMAWNAVSKPALVESMVLLDNLMPNPDGTDCFTYQEVDVDAEDVDNAVIGVAITLTVRTHDKDPNTGDYQTETKALLNVAPRNVFSVWQVASLGFVERVQKLPPSVLALLPAADAEQN